MDMRIIRLLLGGIVCLRRNNFTTSIALDPCSEVKGGVSWKNYDMGVVEDDSLIQQQHKTSGKKQKLLGYAKRSDLSVAITSP